eukprot:6640182-Ditylum_brightwellii.AAC.1
MVIPLIRKSNHKVIDLLLSLKSYDKKLDGKAIANNIITELNKYGIDMKLSGWRVCIMDCAGTNGVAIKELKENNLANPSFGPCHSHTIHLPGKEFSKSYKEMHDFRKHWNACIQACGKCIM